MEEDIFVKMHFGLDDGVSHPCMLMYKNPYKEL